MKIPNQADSQGQRHTDSAWYKYHHNGNAVRVSVHCALVTLLSGDLLEGSLHENTSSKGHESYAGRPLETPGILVVHAR